MSLSQGGEEDRSRHASYVMIIAEQRGCLFFALNTIAGGQGSQAGVQEGEAVQVESSGEQNRKRMKELSRKAERHLERWIFFFSKAQFLLAMPLQCSWVQSAEDKRRKGT